MGMTARDYEDIKQLNARYAYGIDFEDEEALLSCFAVDGGFEGPEHLHRGHADLAEFGRSVAANQLGHVRHSMIHSLIEGDGSAARSLTFAYITRDYGPPQGKGQATHAATLTTGLYDDRIRKIDGRWVYELKTFRHDGWPDMLARLHRPLPIAPVPVRTSVTGALDAIDREAIRQLLARYCYTLDFGDYDGWAACFTEDGVFGSATAPNALQGTAALREFAVYCDEKVQGHAKHSCVNIVIDGRGDEARVSSYGFIPMDYGTPRQWNQRDNATLGTTGLYHDRVVRVDGRWLFEQRTFVYDGWPAALDVVGRPLDFTPFS